MYHIYLFNDLLGSAAQYGIGTYVRELKSIYRSNPCCKFTIITLNANVSNIVKQFDNEIEYVEYPKMSYWGVDVNDKYCRSVAYNLALDINEKELNIFHFNYMHHYSLAMYLKELYSQSYIILVLHFLKTKILEISNAFSTSNSEKKDCKNQEQSFLMLADRIVTLCRDTKIYIQQSYAINPEKIEVVYNFMKDRNNNNLYDNREFLRSKYGFHINDKILLYIGRIDSAKGIIDFKKVFKDLGVDEEIKLLVVGGGKYDKLLSVYAECNSRIILMGEVHDVSMIDELCCISDIGILPSYIEQCSYSAIEMMMHGLPIVGLHSFGLREMFDLHPVSLLCVETEMFKHSHAVMTSLIINLLSNSENIKIEGEKCRFKYEKYYSPLNRNVWRELYSFN